jgi:hypothetical protein
MHKITVGLELGRKPELIFEEPYQAALYNAVVSAKRNLYARFDIRLEGPFRDNALPYPYVIVIAPDTVNLTPGNVGRHLRGIASAMIKQYKELEDCQIGTRLFQYHFLPNKEDRMDTKPEPTKHQYTTEELTDIWAEFEKEQHMIPCTHLCAGDVHKFLEFLKKKEERNEEKTEMR